ncbi:MAG: DNA polymerase III subunit gamma/tau [Patescibacteria group bacterium]
MALYRKYRPQTFAQVTGQNHAKITLQNEIASENLGHAYLFCGPRGTGKTTLARLFAKAINCQNRQADAEPCNECESCLAISSGRSLDIVEIDAASHTGVDNIRENIIESTRFSPSKRQYKVYIIDEVHMLSMAAFNALLKILEEPPKYVIFILATTEVHKIPATVLSRCQRFDLKKLNFQDLVKRLRMISDSEKITIDDNVLEVVARQSGGCARDAESLLEQVFSLGREKITLATAELVLPRVLGEDFLRFWEIILQKRTADGFSFVSELNKNGVDFNLFIDGFVDFLRRILVYKITGVTDELSQDLSDEILRKIISSDEKIQPDYLLLIIKKCLANKETFRQSYLPQLALEAVVLEMTSSAVAMPKVEPMMIKKTTPIAPIEKQAQPDFAIKKEEPLMEQKIEVVEEISEVPICEMLPLSADFTAIWTAVLEKLKTVNYSAFMSLRMGKPIEVSDGRIVLGFIFELQRQRVEKNECKKAIHDILIALTGKTWQIETRIQHGLTMSELFVGEKPNSENAGNSQVDEVAKEFGGTVVDSPAGM